MMSDDSEPNVMVQFRGSASALPSVPGTEGEGSGYGLVKRPRRMGSREHSDSPMGSPRDRSTAVVPVPAGMASRAISLPPVPTCWPKSLGPNRQELKQEWKKRQLANSSAVVPQSSSGSGAGDVTHTSQNTGKISAEALSQIVAINQTGDLVSQIPWNQVYGGVHVTPQMMTEALQKVQHAIRVAYDQGKNSGSAEALANAEVALFAAVTSEQHCHQERELQAYNCEQSVNHLWFQAQSAFSQHKSSWQHKESELQNQLKRSNAEFTVFQSQAMTYQENRVQSVRQQFGMHLENTEQQLKQEQASLGHAQRISTEYQATMRNAIMERDAASHQRDELSLNLTRERASNASGLSDVTL